jgi:TonB family protein
MRQLREPRSVSAVPTADPTASPTLRLLAAAAEESREHRVFRLAVAGAVAFHLAVAFLPLPRVVASAEPQPQKSHLLVVQTPIFKHDVISPVRENDKPAFLVPVPDPAPDDREPIRPLATVPQHLDLPEIAPVGDLPPPPPLPPAGPIEIGGAVVRPVAIDTPQPVYSELARRARIQGVVQLRTILDETGRVTDVEVVKRLPFGLTEAAVEAVQRWRYRPATLNDKPVAVFLQVTVNFQLQ